MRPTPEIIRTKRDGGALTEDDIRGFVSGYTDGSIPDYQAAALLMAFYFQGMQTDELVSWTDAMLHSGDVLDLTDIPGYKVDKHSTGGVGDKVSLILAPLVAEAGVKVPMISGRGLGHTGGTLDKLESIPGFRTDLSVGRFRDLVAEINAGMIGQTAEIAPADKKLYSLRDVTSTVECIPLIASSIMSKKLAEGIDGLVLDVKTGSGAFMANHEDARELARTMVRIGKAAGKDMVALLTDMNQPLGRCVGNSLEVIEACDVLRGDGPADLRELTLALSAEMLVLAGRSQTLDAATTALERILDSGRALERFKRIAEAQGGDPDALEDHARLPTAPNRLDVCAERSGHVVRFECAVVGRAAMLLGAGRARKEDPINPGVGIVLEVERGSTVAAGDPIAVLHYDDERQLAAVTRRLLDAIVIGDSPPEPARLVIERFAC